MTGEEPCDCRGCTGTTPRLGGWQAGDLVNPVPPQPPVGARLAMAHRPTEPTWERKQDGWYVSGWMLTTPQWPKGWCEVFGGYGPLVIVDIRQIPE